MVSNCKIIFQRKYVTIYVTGLLCSLILYIWEYVIMYTYQAAKQPLYLKLDHGHKEENISFY